MGRREREEVVGSGSSGISPDKTPTERQDARSTKRRKTENENKERGTDKDIQDERSSCSETTGIVPAVESSEPERIRPKSRKELRAERKAVKKAAAVVDVVVESTALPATNDDTRPVSEEERKLEKNRLRKERRAESLKERGLKELKERRERNKLRKARTRNRVINAPGGAGGKVGRQMGGGTRGMAGSEAKPGSDRMEPSMEMRVLDDLFNGTRDEMTGTTELRLGVRFIDVVVGDGPAVVDRTLVTVKYKLTGGKFGAVIDSSNRFNFRVGKGEVIRGWDIGLMGMRQGGRRHLIVPPKAGYGSQDIGAGAGATLNFDVTLLECRI